MDLRAGILRMTNKTTAHVNGPYGVYNDAAKRGWMGKGNRAGNSSCADYWIGVF